MTNDKLVIEKEVIENVVKMLDTLEDGNGLFLIHRLRNESTPLQEVITPIVSDAFDAGEEWEYTNWKVGAVDKPNKETYIANLK